MNPPPIKEMLEGSRPALARCLSRVENRNDGADEILEAVNGKTGRALRLGFTGPPGAGKSSLVTAYVKFLRAQDLKVAVIAVDPTSPFSGGALLGDRVRMTAIGLDPGAFVRSLATRGELGGLTRAAGDMADVFDACGFDRILFETVGVGQSELEIVQYADSVSVILVPESGDAIQGMKAGLMEVGDVFVVNKSDRAGADRFTADLTGAVHLRQWTGWEPPAVQTIATKEEGVEELHSQIMRHIDYLKESGHFHDRRLSRIRRRVRKLVDKEVVENFWTEDRLRKMETAIQETRSPYDVTRELLSGVIR